MNIRIVICFIIICILPAPSFGETDKVWLAKSSGLIKSNESLTYENYLVKATTLNNTTALLNVFKDNVQLERKEFKINEFKKYGTVGITLLGVNGNCSWITLSKLEEKDIWLSAGSTILKWGDTYAIDNYSVNIDSMDTDSVNLTISNKTQDTIKTDNYQKDGFVDYENMRIIVRSINMSGQVELDFLKYNAPVIKAEIITDKEEYFPDENITLMINIETDKFLNAASIILEGNNIGKFEPELLTATGISGTRSFNSRITQLSPNSTIIITASIDGRDYYNRPVITKISKSVSITPVVSIMKRIPEDADDDNISVELYVYNSEVDHKFIRVRDAVPEGLSTKQQLAWNIELGPKKSTNITYLMTSQRPATYTLPAAKALWNGQSSASGAPNINVHMPYMRMVKTATNNESRTDVELEITNIGDRPAIVNVEDKIPDGYPLQSGTTWTGFIDAGKSEIIRYSLEGNPVFLPAAYASYRDIRGTVRQTQSNIIQNNKSMTMIPDSRKGNAASINAGQYEIITFMTSFFLVIFGTIGSFAFTAYLITRMGTR